MVIKWTDEEESVLNKTEGPPPPPPSSVLCPSLPLSIYLFEFILFSFPSVYSSSALYNQLDDPHLHHHQSLGLGHSDLSPSEDGQKDPWGEILSIHRTCDLEQSPPPPTPHPSLCVSLTHRQSSSLASFKSERKSTSLNIIVIDSHMSPFQIMM